MPTQSLQFLLNPLFATAEGQQPLVFQSCTTILHHILHSKLSVELELTPGETAGLLWRVAGLEESDDELSLSSEEEDDSIIDSSSPPEGHAQVALPSSLWKASST